MTLSPGSARFLVVGAGRMGNAVTAALNARGADVIGPLGRGDEHLQHTIATKRPDVVLLAVPDGAIAEVAATITPGPIVAHLSGSTTLAPLKPHQAFSVHPLMTVTAQGANFTGVSAAVAGSSAVLRDFAEAVAMLLGMVPFHVSDEDRVTYHAAASIASNFLVTLEVFAEDVAHKVGVPREALAPLVRQAVENWVEHGGSALTGPIVRGDEGTVDRQRRAIAQHVPERLALFDELVTATRAVAQSESNDP